MAFAISCCDSDHGSEFDVEPSVARAVACTACAFAVACSTTNITNVFVTPDASGDADGIIDAGMHADGSGFDATADGVVDSAGGDVAPDIVADVWRCAPPLTGSTGTSCAAYKACDDGCGCSIRTSARSEADDTRPTLASAWPATGSSDTTRHAARRRASATERTTCRAAAERRPRSIVSTIPMVARLVRRIAFGQRRGGRGWPVVARDRSTAARRDAAFARSRIARPDSSIDFLRRRGDSPARRTCRRPRHCARRRVRSRCRRSARRLCRRSSPCSRPRS